MKTIKPNSQNLGFHYVAIPLGIFFLLLAFRVIELESDCPSDCPPSNDPTAYIGWFMITFGISALCLWSGYKRFRLVIGEPRAVITPEQLNPGDRFRFVYRQPYSGVKDVKSIGFYLVYRENVWCTVEDESSKDFERLVQHFIWENDGTSQGNDLIIEHYFEIPDREMGIRNPFMGLRGAEAKTSWHIIAIVNPNRSDYQWFDFALKVRKTSASRIREHSRSEDELYDLYLVGQQPHSINSLPKALHTMFPFWGAGFKNSYSELRPFLVLERVTITEAEAAKAQLEGAGGILRACVESHSWSLLSRSPIMAMKIQASLDLGLCS